MSRSARHLHPLLRALLVILAITPLAWAIYAQWSDFQSSVTKLLLSRYLLAQLLLLAILPVWAAPAWVTLRMSVGAFSYLKALGLFFTAQAAKYLPGGVWAVPGRMLAYQTAGVDRVHSIVIVFRELSAFFLGAASIGLLGYVRSVRPTGAVQMIIAAGMLACLLFLFLLHRPWLWRKVAALKALNIAAWEIESKYLSLAWFPLAFAVSGIFWLLLGVPFRHLAISINPAAEALTLIESASTFALAWSAGFVVVFVPAGLGVRESALAVLLSRVMPVGDALGVAVLSRLWWMIAEALWIAFGLLWVSWSPEVSLSQLKRTKGGDLPPDGVI